MKVVALRSARLLLFLGFAGLFSSSMLAFQAAPGQVVYYKFEETAGNTAADSSGNGFTGNWVTSQGSMAASAAGDCSPNTPGNTRSLILNKPGAVTQAGAHLDTPNNAAFAFTGPFTVMAWIKPSTYNSGDNPNDTGAIVQKWNWTGVEVNGYGMNRNLNGTISFWMGSAGLGSNILTTGATTGVGVWSHVAIVFTGTGRQIFINGAVSTSDNYATLGLSAANLHIGLDDWARNYYGNVDEVRIFNAALSASEIMTYYQGAPPPSGLTATPGIDSATLNWNAVTGASSYNILRSGTTGGPYVQIGNVAAPTTTYTDNTALSPGTYFYVVQTVLGTVTSVNSSEVSCTPIQPPVTARPNTGLQTDENGATTFFTVRFNAPAPAGCVLRVVSNNLAEGFVTTTFAGNVDYPASPATRTGFEIPITAGTSPVITVTVTGVDDAAADGNIPYTVSVTATNVATPIPNVNLTNNDNDTPNITFSRTAGLQTTEWGGTDSFAVALTTRPYGTVTLNLSSSTPGEATVNPTQIIFDSSNYTGVPVVLTGVDDTNLDFGQPFSITSQPLSAPNPSDAAYNGMVPPAVTGVNLDDEVIPEAAHAWGNCGLLGLESALIVALLAAGRRRRRA